MNPPPFLTVVRAAYKAGSSTVATLPAAWCKKHRITHKTILYMEAHHDGRLVLRKWEPPTRDEPSANTPPGDHPAPT